jgi:hypothetical protein
LIANSLSRDLIEITNALCNYSLDMAQVAGKIAVLSNVLRKFVQVMFLCI